MPYTLLVVDDNKIARERLAECLVHRGYSVVTAFDGSEAVRLMQTGCEPHLIVTDVDMPILDGNDLIRWLVANQKTIPVIVVTGWQASFDQSLAGHIAELVQKPFDVNELSAIIEKVLGSDNG